MTKHVAYPIDFEAFSIEEIEHLVTFFAMVEAYHEANRHSPSANEMETAHATYRAILNNRSEEKRIDKAFEKQTGISIYKTMRTIYE